MAFDLDRLTYEELVQLNHKIVERLKFLDQMHAHQEMLRLRIGQRVMFTPSGRTPVTGIVTKYNRKTVTIVTEEGQRWRVSPEFVSAADGAGAGASNVVSIRPDNPPRGGGA
jgi:hypothetical protein